MNHLSKSLISLLALTSVSAFAAGTTPVSQEIKVPTLPAVETPALPEVEVPTTPEVEVPELKEDLAFEGARWGGKAAGYVCEAAVTTFVETPKEYADLNVQFGTVVTDYTLDNGLLLATFDADETTTCRYSAIVLANSTTKDITLVKSRAFASVGEGSCAAGKAVLDAKLAANKYLWKESRKHLTILAPSVSAEAICGEGVENVGIDFVFTGKIN